MKKYVVLLYLLFLVSGVVAQMKSTRPSPYGFEINMAPPIYYEIYLSYPQAGDGPKINLSVSIQNDLLFFVKNEDGYASRYDISVNIKESKTNMSVLSHLWKEIVVEKDYENTNAKDRYQKPVKQFDEVLPAGEYTLYLEMTDETSGNSYKNTRKFKIPDIKTAGTVSDVKLLDSSGDASAEIVIGEELPIIRFDQDIVAQLLVVPGKTGQVSILSKLFHVDEDDEEQLVREMSYTPQTRLSLLEFRENIARKFLDEEKYHLNYSITVEGEEAEVRKEFKIVWFEKPEFLYSIELALRPLRYLLAPEELEKVDDMSDSEQKIWFQSFWEVKDPNPETRINEIQYEFYQRVMTANKNFQAKYNEGWDTTRGKNYIMYGDPDKIDSRRYLTDGKPYETWYYYGMNKKLTFVDINEDDSFQLVNVETIGDTNHE